MESIDYWLDSQDDSIVDFDGSMQMFVPDSITNGEEAADVGFREDNDVMEAIKEEYTDVQVANVNEASIVVESSEDVGSIMADSSEVIEPIVEDTYCDENEVGSGRGDNKLEPIVDFRRVKNLKVTDSRSKVIHHFDLNLPCNEEKDLAGKKKIVRDFDLNKLPIAGMFRLTDPSREADFIQMLRLLLPSFY